MVPLMLQRSSLAKLNIVAHIMYCDIFVLINRKDTTNLIVQLCNPAILWQNV